MNSLNRTRLFQRISPIAFFLCLALSLAGLPVTGCGGPEYPKCEQDEDCHAGEYCVNGLCQACRNDTDCELGNRCVTGRCEPIEDYCLTADDCGAGKECQSNRCVEAETSAIPSREPKSEPTAQECEVSSIYFAFDSANLKPQSRDQLVQNAECLKEKGAELLRLTGYCDPRGTEEYNLALGERRARSTKRYIQSLGVQIATYTHSMGEEMARGTDESSWAKDRRVEFKYKHN